MIPADGRIQKIKTTKAREEFGSVVDRVAYTKRPVLLERRGKPLAVLVPMEDYRLLERLIEEEEDRIDAEDGEKALRESAESTPYEEFRKELGLNGVRTSPGRKRKARHASASNSNRGSDRPKTARAG